MRFYEKTEQEGVRSVTLLKGKKNNIVFLILPFNKGRYSISAEHNKLDLRYNSLWDDLSFESQEKAKAFCENFDPKINQCFGDSAPKVEKSLEERAIATASSDRAVQILATNIVDWQLNSQLRKLTTRLIANSKRQVIPEDEIADAIVDILESCGISKIYTGKDGIRKANQEFLRTLDTLYEEVVKNQQVLQKREKATCPRCGEHDDIGLHRNETRQGKTRFICRRCSHTFTGNREGRPTIKSQPMTSAERVQRSRKRQKINSSDDLIKLFIKDYSSWEYWSTTPSDRQGYGRRLTKRQMKWLDDLLGQEGYSSSEFGGATFKFLQPDESFDLFVRYNRNKVNNKGNDLRGELIVQHDERENHERQKRRPTRDLVPL